MITIIDYGLGNLASVANALKKLEIPYLVSSDIEVLKNSKAIILPGVGAAGQGMENLKIRKLDKIIIEQAKKGTAILGICLGMQLLMDWSEEGNVNCLGLIMGRVKRFDTNLKVPQIGWNTVIASLQNDKREAQQGFDRMTLLNKIPDNSNFYFVNSYYCDPENKNTIKGITNYGLNFCSVVEKDNLYGVQFHPEKSGDIGLQFLKNFISLSFP